MSHVPERVVAEIKDDHSARVTWEPPGCNAGPILHYNLYHDGGFMATLRRMLSVRAPHCIIRNLLVRSHPQSCFYESDRMTRLAR